jgi:SAM-dependent methyltransferase
MHETAPVEPEISDDYTDPRLARFYDQLNASRRDVGFYVDLIKSAGSVLDVGCGTGLMLREARAAGATGRLVGLDPAAAMLDQARVRADVEWILGDLGTAAFDHEFDLVLMTGHVMDVFLTDDELTAVLAGVHAALAPGGRFVFESFNPVIRPWERWIGSTVLTTPDGSSVTTGNTGVQVLDGNIVEIVGEFSSPSWDRPVVCPSRLRMLEVATLDGFLARAGFTVAERYGDWDFNPFTEEKVESITIAVS